MKNKFKDKILGKIAGVFGLRLSYSALTFISSVVFVRVLGTSGFGIYTYVVVWAYLLSVPATMGLDNFIVREIAVYQSQESWGLMRGLLAWANRAVLLTAIGLSLVSILIAWGLEKGAFSETFIAFCVAMALMPALSLRNIRRGAMKGLHRITQGMLPELLIDPLILLVLTGGAYLLLRQQVTVLWVVGFYGMGSCLTLLLVSQFLQRALPKDVRGAKPTCKGRFWLQGTLPFLLVESIPVINAQLDVLMLGGFHGADAVGLYVPISRSAQLITFILMAVGSTLAPNIASAYANNQLPDLQKTITKSVRLVVGVAFLFAFSLSFGSNWYLAIFGPEYLQGQNALYIFCIGSFLSTSMGLSYVILNMTGNEQMTAIVGWVSVGLNIVLNAIFIPIWGVEGAAFATSLGTLTGALVSLITVRLKLGIDATAIGLFAKLPNY